jgi:hypothetical protein
MLKPRNQSWSLVAPRAISAIVVPSAFETFSWQIDDGEVGFDEAGPAIGDVARIGRGLHRCGPGFLRRQRGRRKKQGRKDSCDCRLPERAGGQCR